MNFDLNLAELGLLRAALSFLVTHVPEAEDELDINISKKDVAALEEKIYGGKR